MILLQTDWHGPFYGEKDIHIEIWVVAAAGRAEGALGFAQSYPGLFDNSKQIFSSGTKSSLLNFEGIY